MPGPDCSMYPGREKQAPTHPLAWKWRPLASQDGCSCIAVGGIIYHKQTCDAHNDLR